MLFTFCILYIRHISDIKYIDFHSEKLSRAKRMFCPLRQSLFRLFSSERQRRLIRFIHSRYVSLLATVSCVWRLTTQSARVRKTEKIFSAMCVYVRKPRLVATARRLKAKRACLANISKTKCKLTRRPFGVYTTPRSPGRGIGSRRERSETLSAQ